MQILTKSYNDFTGFTYEQKNDKDFLLNVFEEFIKSGGDLSLPIKSKTSYDGKSELISFKDFISQNIDSPQDFINELTQKGLIEGIYNFKYDKKSGIISENEEHGIRKMRTNINEHSKLIESAIIKLIKDLPEDYNEIKGLKTFDWDGAINILTKENPLFTIANTLNTPKVYELIFNKYPKITSLWKEKNINGEEKFISCLETRWGECGDYGIAKTFYKHNVCKEYIISNEKIAQDFIRKAALNGDKTILLDILPKVNLAKIEEGKYSCDLSLTKAANREIAEILLSHGAVLEQFVYSRSGNDKYLTNVLFSDDLKEHTIMEAILDRDLSIVKTKEKDLYQLITNKDKFFLRTLIENYEFPKNKYDLLITTYQDIEEAQYLKERGVDLYICDEYCRKAVADREDGLKKIRAINKAGIINVKNPNILYNILSQNPTKNFISYLEKFDTEVIDGLTKKGYPGWWGCSNKSNLITFITKSNNPENKSEYGISYPLYLLKRELNEKIDSPLVMLGTYLHRVKKINPNYKINLDETDDKGNNILHYVFFTKKYKKDRIDTDLFKLIEENTEQNIYDYFNKKNNEGKTPLENIYNTDIKQNNWVINTLLEKILEDSDHKVLLNEKDTNGEKIGDKLIQEFGALSNLDSKISKYLLEEELCNKSQQSKRMKI